MSSPADNANRFGSLDPICVCSEFCVCSRLNLLAGSSWSRPRRPAFFFQHWSSGLFRPLGKLLPAPLMSLQRGQPLNKKLFTFVNTSEKDTYRAGAVDALEPVPSRWSLVPTLLSYPSVQYLARRDTPPLPVAPNRGAHRSLPP